jgi:hypothetical protein
VVASFVRNRFPVVARGRVRVVMSSFAATVIRAA